MSTRSGLWLPGLQQVVSPNADERPPGSEVDLLVIHNISLPPGEFGGPWIDDLFLNRLDPSRHPYFNQLKALGMPIAKLVVEGAKRRLRPVLMTASIAAFGLVPLLFASGPGSEIQRPLAIVVIGGLITSTALTLLIIPAVYSVLDRRQ